MTPEQVSEALAARTPGPWDVVEKRVGVAESGSTPGTKRRNLADVRYTNGDADARAITVAVNLADEWRAVAEAARFRASADFINFDPQPTGPDLLDAIAAYMDRQDDAHERRTGEKAVRTVQADVRRWAEELRTALDALDKKMEALW